MQDMGKEMLLASDLSFSEYERVLAVQMLSFQYKGISQGKYVEGDIEAINEEDAAFKLKNQKVIITKLQKSKKKRKHIDEYEYLWTMERYSKEYG